MELIIDKLEIIDDIKECIKFYFRCEVCGCVSRLRRLGYQWVCRGCRLHWVAHYAGYCRELGLHHGLYLHLGRIRLDWFRILHPFVAYLQDPADDHVDIRDAVIALLFEACAPQYYNTTTIRRIDR